MIASQAKKEKDKQDRENQKKQGEDRNKKAQQKAAGLRILKHVANEKYQCGLRVI